MFQNRSRPCLLHQIRRCSAPCVGLIDAARYAQDVNDARLFMEGREDDVVGALAARMQEAAERLDYEQAAIYRDQLRSLARVQTRQYVDTGESAGCRRRRLRDRERHRLRQSGDDPQRPPPRRQELLPAERRGPVRAGGDWSVPRAALPASSRCRRLSSPRRASTPTSSTHCSRRMRDTRCRSSRARTPNGAHGWRWRSEMPNRRWRKAAGARHPGGAARGAARGAGAAAVGAAHRVLRRQPYQGEATVASCVVYDQVRMRNSEYRRYNIAGTHAGRRLRGHARRAAAPLRARWRAGEGVVPDLILIDGGKGQLHAVQAVLAELGFADIAAGRRRQRTTRADPGSRNSCSVTVERCSSRSRPSRRCTSSSRSATRRTASRSPGTARAAARPA